MTAIDDEVYEVESEVPLDLIAWRRYHRRTPGLVEKALALNPGLAALGANIPRGTIVRLPIDKPPSTTRLPLVRLWD